MKFVAFLIFVPMALVALSLAAAFGDDHFGKTAVGTWMGFASSLLGISAFTFPLAVVYIAALDSQSQEGDQHGNT